MNHLIVTICNKLLRAAVKAQGTSFPDGTKGTSATSMTSAVDTSTIPLTEMTTSASLMNGMTFNISMFEKLIISSHDAMLLMLTA